MNDSPVKSERENSDALEKPAQIAERERKFAAEIEIQTGRQPLEPASLGENIIIPPDKLNDLFLEAERTARQKAIAELERLKIENQKLQIENQGLELQHQRLKDGNLRLSELHGTRKQYVGRLFWLIAAWLGVVIAMVALSATLKDYFALESSVLIAFITSTTVSVIALFVIVAKWLFPSPGDEKKEK